MLINVFPSAVILRKKRKHSPSVARQSTSSVTNYWKSSSLFTPLLVAVNHPTTLNFQHEWVFRGLSCENASHGWPHEDARKPVISAFETQMLTHIPVTFFASVPPPVIIANILSLSAQISPREQANATNTTEPALFVWQTWFSALSYFVFGSSLEHSHCVWQTWKQRYTNALRCP